MAKLSSTQMKKIASLLKNPMVQRILAWGLPIVIGWVLSRFDKPKKTSRKK